MPRHRHAEGFPENKPVKFGFNEPVLINQSGYIYIWLSNESKDTRVWFDDLTITHTQNLVVQASDYGVWGDVLREQKSDESKYRFGYQGQFAEKDEETGWNHFELREYDVIVGRWMASDPESQYFSPYKGMGNSPINGVDIDGAWFGKIRAQAAALFHAGEYGMDLDGNWYALWDGKDPNSVSEFARNYGEGGINLDNVSFNFGANGRYSLGPQIALYANGVGGEAGFLSAELLELGGNLSFNFRDGFDVDLNFDYIGKNQEGEFVSRLGAGVGIASGRVQHDLIQGKNGRQHEASGEAKILMIYGKTNGQFHKSGRIKSIQNEVGGKLDFSLGAFAVVDGEFGFNAKF